MKLRNIFDLISLFFRKGDVHLKSFNIHDKDSSHPMNAKKDNHHCLSRFVSGEVSVTSAFSIPKCSDR